MSDQQPSLRPWWKEPMAIAFGVLILSASVAVMCQGWSPPPKPIDPTGRAALPGDGSFCDPVTHPQGTLENPSTQGKPVVNSQMTKPESPNQ